MSVEDVTEVAVRRGTYVGDGNATQDITLFTRPKYIRIFSNDGTMVWVNDGDAEAKMHFVNIGGVVKFGKHHTAITISDTGFTVSGRYVNTLGVEYMYEWEV